MNASVDRGSLAYESLVEQAESAQNSASWSEAETLWAKVRQFYPDDPRGFLAGAWALKHLERPSEAAALLSQAAQVFPSDPDVLTDHAWTVMDSADHERASPLWKRIREEHPDHLGGYLGGGLARRWAHDFDEADRIYEAAMGRYPDSDAVRVDFAWSAEERGNTPEALRRWQVVRERHPARIEGALRSGLLLRDSGRLAEADEALRQAVALEPRNEEALNECAWIAQLREDWPEALRRWEAVLKLYPDRARARRFAAEALMQLGRYMEAASVLAPAVRMYPDDPEIGHLQGWLASRSRPTDAERVWTDIRQRFPDTVDGYHGHAMALRDQSRFEEAERLLAEASGRFPEDPLIAMDFALMAEVKHDWPLAIFRWRDVQKRFPDDEHSWVGLANALAGAKQLPEAEALYVEALRKFPRNLHVFSSHAELAESASEWATALTRWTAVKYRFPQEPQGFFGYGRTLRVGGQLHAAAHFLRDCARRFPDYFMFEVELAFTLSAQRNWKEALPLWNDLRARYPTNSNIRSNIVSVVGQAVADQAIDGAGFEIPSTLLELDSEDEERKRQAELLKRFESLGDSCEFGMVQRFYHVEQMSLLRWARTTPEMLTEALNKRFAGVGEEQYTRIEVYAGEYVTSDTRYQMHSHTFTSPTAEPEQTFKPEQCRRMQWLKRKLIDNLTMASKVFVYMRNEDPLTDDAINLLFAALLRYSPGNRLLCVRLATQDRPAGHVEQLEPGLFIGYIDKFSTVDISIDLWLRLCAALVRQLEAT